MKYKIGFIGSGNMGGALLSNVALNNKDIIISVYDKNEDKAAFFASNYSNVVYSDIKTLVTESEYIVIGVKPQMLAELAMEISQYLDNKKDQVIISMAAGTSIDKIKSLFSSDAKVIRIMPNTPAMIGKGVILYSPDSEVNKKATDEFSKMFSGCGILDMIPENMIDAASAVSGCGPAYVYMFIEALADGAVKCGVPRDKALKYAAAMVSGSAEMVLKSGQHPEKLKDDVCSPGGTTIAGVYALEERGFRGACISAVNDAYKKTIELK